MVTFRVRYGQDAAGTDAWVLDESGSRIEAFVTKQQAMSRASNLAQKEAARSGTPSTLIVEKKNGSVQKRKEVEAGETSGFGSNVFGI